MKKVYIYLFAPLFLLILSLSAGLNMLTADQNILQLKCTKCHGLKDPANYTKDEWKYNVERMALRAGLTPQEIQTVIELNKKK